MDASGHHYESDIIKSKNNMNKYIISYIPKNIVLRLTMVLVITAVAALALSFRAKPVFAAAPGCYTVRNNVHVPDSCSSAEQQSAVDRGGACFFRQDANSEYVSLPCDLVQTSPVDVPPPFDETDLEEALSQPTTDNGATTNDPTSSGEAVEFSAGSGACNRDALLFGIFPKWYRYLPVKNESPCELGFSGETTSPNDRLKMVGLVIMAVLEMLTKAAGILAVAWVIMGGIKYIMSQGEPEQLNSAKSTILNAIVGLVITIFATGIVMLVANRVSGG